MARDVLRPANMRVRDVMRKEVRTIGPSEPASMAKELFRRYDIHHLVVVDRKNVIGMLADRDLMTSAARLRCSAQWRIRR